MKFSYKAYMVFYLYNYTETDSIFEALQKLDIGGDGSALWASYT